MSPIYLLLIAGSLLCLPLVLRYATAHKMRRWRERLLDQEEDFGQLREELEDLREECKGVIRQQKHDALRRSRLLAQIEEARLELARMRRPEVRKKIAA